MNNYKKYLRILKDDGSMDFHTIKSEKKHAFILRGLDSQTDTSEIINDLENKHKLNVHNIFKLKNTKRDLYLVTVDSNITLKHLNKNIQYVYHTRVYWERRNNTSEIIQCRRCQQFSHATTNCMAVPKCLKCAASHWSRDCQNVHKDDKDTAKYIKCANCLGSHLAFSRECPIYIKKIEM